VHLQLWSLVVVVVVVGSVEVPCKSKNHADPLKIIQILRNQFVSEKGITR